MSLALLSHLNRKEIANARLGVGWGTLGYLEQNYSSWLGAMYPLNNGFYAVYNLDPQPNDL